MKILIIQTAFIGDVILATPVIESLNSSMPNATIDFLLRKGNESLFNGHPFLNKVIIWDKKSAKFSNLLKIIKEVRKTNYDVVINLHRFASSGLITFLSGAKTKVGFDKNPFSFCYTKKVKHIIGDGRNECERNLELVESGQSSVVSGQADNTKFNIQHPKLYPSQSDYESVKQFKSSPYICIAPASVWFTKQFPANKWLEFLNSSAENGLKVYLLGSESDKKLCEEIITLSHNKNIENLAGKLTFLQSAALMQDAVMNYCNDSAPLHIASSVNAPVTALFLSTVPAFGFGPLSDKSFIVETNVKLDCKPCGLHGFKACPRGHFKCALTIEANQLTDTLKNS